MIAAAARVPRAALAWLGAAYVALTILVRIARGEVVVLSGHAAPVVRLVAIVVVFLASCAEKLMPAEQKPAEQKPAPSEEEEAAVAIPEARPEPVVAAVQAFPDDLDDAALERALRWIGRRTLWLYFEAEAGRPRSDPLTLDRAPAGGARLLAAISEHQAWAERDEPATVASLTELLDAAEAVPMYDAWLAGHLWRHARTMRPAPASLFGRLERHLRVVQAVGQGEASTGRIEFSAWRSKAGPPPGWTGLQVPAGLVAAARAAFAKADAGTWETGAVLALTVAQGDALLLRRGGEATLVAGTALRLRRLDVVRAPAGARLRHASLGELVVPAGGELTAWNAGELLVAAGQAKVQARVRDALAGEAAALAELEGYLPLAHLAIRAGVAAGPEQPGAAGLRLLLTSFDE